MVGTSRDLCGMGGVEEEFRQDRGLQHLRSDWSNLSVLSKRHRLMTLLGSDKAHISPGLSEVNSVVALRSME